MSVPFRKMFSGLLTMRPVWGESPVGVETRDFSGEMVLFGYEIVLSIFREMIGHPSHEWT